jgi:hypothetical protein
VFTQKTLELLLCKKGGTHRCYEETGAQNETQSRYKMDVEGGGCFVVQSEVETCLSVVHFVVGLHTHLVFPSTIYYAELALHGDLVR